MFSSFQTRSVLCSLSLDARLPPGGLLGAKVPREFSPMPPRRGRGRGEVRPAPSIEKTAPSIRRSRRGDPAPAPVLPPSQAESPPALQLDLSHGKPLPTSAFRGPTSATGLQHQALSEASSVEEDYLGIGAQTTSASGPAASADVSSSSTAAATAAPALTAAVGTADGAGDAAEPEVVADATATAEPAAAGVAAPAGSRFKEAKDGFHRCSCD